MVESPAGRRVALPRLAIAVVLASCLILLVSFVAAKLIGTVTGWVASRPEYQFRFSEIELVPPPHPWVLGGRLRILGDVRVEAHHGETISILDFNREALEKDFKRCAWIKGVVQITREYGHLSVHLAYRKPVAVVALPIEKGLSNVYLIDEEGAILPPDDIDWVVKGPHQFLVRGMADPLIEIRNVGATAPTRFGVPWKQAGTADSPGGEPNLMVLHAAKLAEFLRSKQRPDSPKSKLPTFTQIYVPDEPNDIFFLADSEKNWVQWGKAPGDEKPGELSAEERWTMLSDWVDRNGPIDAKDPYFLQLKRSGPERVRGTSRRKKGPGAG